MTRFPDLIKSRIRSCAAARYRMRMGRGMRLAAIFAYKNTEDAPAFSARCVLDEVRIDFLRSKFLGAMLHLRLEPQQNRTVHLADARFGKIERHADLLHRHLFVVVQHDNEPLRP